MAAVKASEAHGDLPLLRTVELSRVAAGVPSADLEGILVSNLCFAHNSPSPWTLLGQAMASRLLCPLHVLALVTPRVPPQRRAQPEAYRLPPPARGVRGPRRRRPLAALPHAAVARALSI